MSPSPATAIVTGASRGIGASIAYELAAKGTRVIVNYATSETRAAKVVADIRSRGGEAHAIAADVADSDAFARLFEEAEASIGRIECLVNNAGIMASRRIADVEDAWFARIMAINVGGVLNGCRLAASRLADGGAIINLSTSVIGLSPAGYGPYCASKAAVEALTRSLAKELGKRRIRANAVAPGPTDTELLAGANTSDRLEAYRNATPLERLGQSDDVASVVAFLVTPAAGWINGQTLRVNGGMVS